MQASPLPPELLHNIIEGVVGTFVYDVLVGNIALLTNPTLNPIVNLLRTSCQIREITLQVLSGALGIPFDAKGIGRMTASPWSRLRQARLIIQTLTAHFRLNTSSTSTSDSFSPLLQNYLAIAENIDAVHNTCTASFSGRARPEGPLRKWSTSSMEIYERYREHGGLWGPLRRWSIHYWAYRIRAIFMRYNAIQREVIQLASGSSSWAELDPDLPMIIVKMARHLRSLQNELDMASVDVEDKYQVIGISLETRLETCELFSWPLTFDVEDDPSEGQLEVRRLAVDVVQHIEASIPQQEKAIC